MKKQFCNSFLIAYIKKRLFGTPDNNQNLFLILQKVTHFRVYLVDVTLQDVDALSRGSKRQLNYTVLGPCYYNTKNLDQTSFPNRAVKTFLFRGIILKIRKSLRWGTSDSMKLSKWDHVMSLPDKRKPPP